MNEQCPFEPDFQLTKKRTDFFTNKVKKSMTQDQSENMYFAYSPEVMDMQKNSSMSPVKTSKKPALVIEKSEQMIQKLKDQRFQEIFEDLLPDIKGFINKETIYRSKISPKIRNIIKPLLDGLEKSEERLNFTDFCGEMNSLMKKVNQADKTRLLQSKRIPASKDYCFSQKKGSRRSSSSLCMPSKILRETSPSYDKP